MSSAGSSEHPSADDVADRRALGALVIDNPDLERLETLLDEFNIFEAAGWTRQEARHSAFLAFLLDPRQTHGLGDAFVKRFLQRVLQSAGGGELPISPIELDLWSLDGLLVLREWQNIDILLLDETHKLAVIIENKIDSGEHDDQLNRYWLAVTAQHPGWMVLGVYLSPDGSPPSHDAYVTADYSLVLRVIEQLLLSRAASLGTDVQVALRTYTRMLRRYIVPDSEIDQLCQRIYQKHRRALELIFQKRPTMDSGPLQMFSDLIEQERSLIRLQVRATTVSFVPVEWDVEALRTGTSSLGSGLLMFFTVNQTIAKRTGSLDLRPNLAIGPGPSVIRQQLLDGFRAAGIVGRWQTPLGSGWNYPKSIALLTVSDPWSADPETTRERASQRWQSFLTD